MAPQIVHVGGATGPARSITSAPAISNEQFKNLSDLKISKNGEIQFSITTTENEMLLHYARHDGSRSSSGYRAKFREDDACNTRMTGAHHQDGTFTIRVNHIDDKDAKKVKIDFVIDNNTKDINVTLGRHHSCKINTKELRDYIQQSAGGTNPVLPPKPTSPKLESVAVPKNNPESSEEERPQRLTGRGVGGGQGSSATVPLPLATLPAVPTSNSTPLTPERAERIKKEEDRGTSPISTNAAIEGKAAEGIKKEAVRKEARAEQEAKALTEPVTSPKTAALKQKIKDLKDNPPSEQAKQQEVAKELAKTQKVRFADLDKEAEAIENRMKQINDPASNRYQEAQQELNENRTLKAELITERVKLNQELAKSSDIKVQRSANNELYRLRKDAPVAYDELGDAESKLKFTEQVSKIERTGFQKLSETVSAKVQGVKDYVSSSPKLEKLGKIAKFIAERSSHTEAGKALIAELALADAEKLNSGELAPEKTRFQRVQELIKGGVERLKSLWNRPDSAKKTVDSMLRDHKYTGTDYRNCVAELAEAEVALAQEKNNPTEYAKKRLLSCKSLLEHAKVQELLSTTNLEGSARVELENRGAKIISEQMVNLTEMETFLKNQLSSGKITDPAKTAELNTVLEQTQADIMDFREDANKLEAKQKQDSFRKKALSELDIANKNSESLKASEVKTVEHQRAILEAELEVHRKVRASILFESEGIKERIKHRSQFSEKLKAEQEEVTKRNNPLEDNLKEVLKVSIEIVEEDIADSSTRYGEEMQKSKSLAEYHDKKASLAQEKLNLHDLTHPADTTKAVDSKEVDKTQRKIRKLQSEIVKLEKTIPPDQQGMKSAEAIKSAPDTIKSVDLKTAQIIDQTLSERQVQLDTTENPNETQKTQLNKIRTDRAKLALNVKATLENQLQSCTPEEQVVARKALYETWADRIENALSDGDKAKFKADRTAYEVESLVNNTKYSSEIVKSASTELENAKKVVENAKAEVKEWQKSDVEVREVQVEKAKIQELLDSPTISDTVKAELNRIKGNILGKETFITEKLVSDIGTEIVKNAQTSSPEMRARELSAQTELFDLKGERQKLFMTTLSDEAIRVENEYNQAKETLEKLKKAKRLDPTQENKLKTIEGELDLQRKNLAKLDLEKQAHESLLESKKKYLAEELEVKSKNGSAEEQKMYEEAKKPLIDEIAKVKSVLEYADAKTNLINKQIELAKTKVEVHKLENPANGTVVDADKVNTSKERLKSLEIEITEAERLRAQKMQATGESAKKVVESKIRATFKNPIVQMGIISSLHQAIDAAIHADLRDEAAHTYCPSLLASILDTDPPYGYLENYRTTKELGKHIAQAYEFISNGGDAAIQFAGAVGLFHFATAEGKGTLPYFYNQTLGRTALGKSVGSAIGNKFATIGNPLLVAGAAYGMGYSSTASGNFIRGNTGTDFLDLSTATAGTVIFGPSMFTAVTKGAWGGPAGVAVSYVIQAAGTFHGINVALNHLDQECKKSLVKSGVVRSVDRALNRGGYLNENERERPPGSLKGRELFQRPAGSKIGSDAELTEEESAINDLAMFELYKHMMAEARQEKVPSPIFQSKKLSLNKYSIPELEKLGLAVKHGVDLNAEHIQAHNFNQVSNFLSYNVDKGLASTPLIGGAFYYTWLGSTATDSIEDEGLRAKVAKDVEAIREFYSHVYDNSLRVEVSSSDNSSTASQFWSGYLRSGLGDWAGRAIDDNTDGRLNSTVEIVDHMRTYADVLVHNVDFDRDVIEIISRKRNNVFELLGPLKKFYPGLDTILQSEESLSLLKNSFKKYDTRILPDGKEEIYETDKYHEFGQAIIDFKNYSDSLLQDPKYQAFVKDLRDPKKLIFAEDGSLLDPSSFREFYPGIENYLTADVYYNGGQKIIENMIGKDNPLIVAIRDRLKPYENNLVSLPLNPDVEAKFKEKVLNNAGNAERLKVLLDAQALNELDSGFYTLEKGFNVETHTDGTGLIDPVGMRLPNKKGTVFVRSFRDRNTNKIVSGVLVVKDADFKAIDDPYIKKAHETYLYSFKEGKVRFNEGIYVNERESKIHIPNVDIYSPEVRSDGSVYMSGHDNSRGAGFGWIVNPIMEKGVLKWRKEHAHKDGKRILRGRLEEDNKV